MQEGHTRSFRQTREDHSNETAADYVELIEELTRERGEARGADLSRILGISQVTVTRTLQRLARDGYVVAQPYRSVFLTPKGAELAETSRERHRVIVALLEKIGVGKENAERDAEGMEHHVSAPTLDAIKRFLSG